jgi:hypothetical protein
MCEMFRKEFTKAYSKYAQPQKDQSGQLDKLGLVQKFQKRTQELQQEYTRIQFENNESLIDMNKESGAFTVSEILDQEDEQNTMKLKEINLTNQLIGEVQHFVFVMRWVIY